MEILKRIVRAFVYAFVGGFAGGMGAIMGGVPTRFRLNIRVFKVASMIAIPASILLVYFKIADVSLSKEILKLISVFVAAPLPIFIGIMACSCVEYVEYAARGAQWVL
ncbi:MAG: hypothetical protein LBF34_03265 [Puniceicoccales bacterium]|jgi:hypothetical protein|nr:hypothetical protein [Puniceicoccales bacterium]